MVAVEGEYIQIYFIVVIIGESVQACVVFCEECDNEEDAAK